jgi:hypothetical protein
MQTKKARAQPDPEEGQIERQIFRVIWIVLGLLALWLLSITGPKLYTMTQIRGWLPGASSLEKTITGKASQDYTVTDTRSNRRDRSGTNYLIAWDEQDVLQVGPNRINLERAAWDELQIGDSIELIKLPKSESYYLRKGIFASNGNFVFDALVFVSELALLAISLIKLFRPAKPTL